MIWGELNRSAPRRGRKGHIQFHKLARQMFTGVNRAPQIDTNGETERARLHIVTFSGRGGARAEPQLFVA